MHKIQMFQVDAFTNRLFAGNPAAVCLLHEWLEDSALQAIAAENNLSETAFVCVAPAEQPSSLRWFTPGTEVDLCGHATLATAHVLFNHLKWPAPQIDFTTRSGLLSVSRSGNELCMDFPALTPVAVAAPTDLCAMLGQSLEQTLGSMDLLVVLADEHAVVSLQPDMAVLLAQPYRGVVFTAASQTCDFVSRAFYPGAAILEDPVTGSAHCQLTPYWAKRLGKSSLRARQVSARGGDLRCELSQDGTRVKLFGQAVTFLQGEILLPD